mmetsp:Transcript_22614/g.40834  ORF Transcript_22614/g.40834 Transcript_22614/m.40834 type:complete len:415 (-) Transcript_22614:842-2086(-)
MTAEEDVEKDTQRPNVHLLRVRLHSPREDLPGHVDGRADLRHKFLLRIFLSCREVDQLQGGFVDRHRLGQEEVFKLDVPMANLVRVQEINCVGELLQHSRMPGGRFLGIASLHLGEIHGIIQPSAVAQLQNHEDLCFVLEGLVERTDIFVPDLPHDVDLIPNASLVGLSLGLDGHGELGIHMPSSPNGAGVPIAQVLHDLVDILGMSLSVPAVDAFGKESIGDASSTCEGVIVGFDDHVDFHVVLCLCLFCCCLRRFMKDMFDFLKLVCQHRANEATLPVDHALQERCFGLHPAFVHAFTRERGCHVSTKFHEEFDEIWIVLCDGNDQWLGHWSLAVRIYQRLHPHLQIVLFQTLQHFPHFLEIDLLCQEEIFQRVRSRIGLCWRLCFNHHVRVWSRSWAVALLTAYCCIFLAT